MKTVFLHVGNFKTGTTAIQAYCHKHRASLESAGLYYPTSGRPKNNLTNHGKLSLSLLCKLGGTPPLWYVQKDAYDGVATAIRAELETSTCDRILISSEEFYRLAWMPPERQQAAVDALKALFDGFNVRVLMYVREPVSLLKSWYNQANKVNLPRSRFIDFVANVGPGIVEPASNANFWRQCFGEECLNIQLYQMSGSQHIAHFLELTGTRIPDLAQTKGSQFSRNQSISSETLEQTRLRRILALDDKQEQDRFLRCHTFANRERILKLQQKIQTINERYTLFCNNEHLPAPKVPLSLNELLLLEEKIHPKTAIKDISKLSRIALATERLKQHLGKLKRTVLS